MRPDPLRALKERNFRWYWSGLASYSISTEIQRFMTTWLAYDLSGSRSLLGLTGFGLGIPNLLFAPFGGLLADRLGSAWLISATQTANALISVALAVLLFSGSAAYWQILLFAILVGCITAFDQPARQSVVPRLVPRDVLPGAVALGSTAWSSARIIGPAIAGALLALFLATGVGPGGVLVAAAAGSFYMCVALSRVHLPEIGKHAARGSMLTELAEGFHYIWGNPAIRSIVGIVFSNNLFGASFIVLMPVFAREVYGIDEQALGLLVACYGIGALVGVVVLTALGGARRAGRLLLIMATLFGGVLVALSLSRSPVLSIPIMVAAGATNAWAAASANTLVQLGVPDRLRGRVMGIYALSHNLPAVGAGLAGLVAEAWGAPVAVGLGGVLVIVTTAALGVMTPGLRHLD